PTRFWARTGCPITWRAPTRAGLKGCWCDVLVPIRIPLSGRPRWPSVQTFSPASARHLVGAHNHLLSSLEQAMAGLDRNTPSPQEITLHSQSRVLEIAFADDQVFRLPFELLRVYSPSAE